MLGQQVALGCPPVNGQPDAACLCRNVDFGYGVRDCVNEACPSGTDTAAIIRYGVNYCASAGCKIVHTQAIGIVLTRN